MEAKGGEFRAVDADASEVMVDLGDGIPKPGALEVMGNTVSGAVGEERAAEATRGVGEDAKPGVGDPGVAPGLENRKPARGRHARGDFAGGLESA